MRHVWTLGVVDTGVRRCRYWVDREIVGEILGRVWVRHWESLGSCFAGLRAEQVLVICIRSW